MFDIESNYKMKFFIGILLAVMAATATAQESEQTVPILAYHRVTNDRAAGETVISPERFAEHVDMFSKEGYTLIRIEELVSFMRSQIKLPRKTVAVTFDDGWKDQLEAAKLMASKNMAATFYVTSGHFDNPLYMTEKEVADLAMNRLFEIGAHSHTHFPELEGKDPHAMDLRSMVGEMMMSKSILERITNRDIKDYAWPFGYATTESVQYAERLGFASTAMINSEAKNKVGRTLELQRLNISGNCTATDLKAMLETGNLGDCK